MNTRLYLYFLLFALASVIGVSCKKYLAASPAATLTIPTTVAQFQSILDYSNRMNNTAAEEGEIAADNYFVTDANFNYLKEREREAYLWEPGLFPGESGNDWDNEYSVVYTSNVVLNGLNGVARTGLNATDYDLCKGMALGFRADAFFRLAQIFAKGYDSATASTDLGVALRLSPDFNVLSTRATLARTYHQILQDMTTAIQLLPAQAPSFQYRLYKGSAFGLLARVYLAMRAYPQALAAADSALGYNSTLLDYNTVPQGSYFTFSPLQYTNPEDMLHMVGAVVNEDLLFYNADVDSTLYQSYAANDLRKVLFFSPNGDGTYFFSGSYEGDADFYCGVATDELYLTKAECEARAGGMQNSMSDLNALLVKRWVTGTFVPYSAPNASIALTLVLSERRKELLFRMLRFTDIKRLNLEGANITLTRIIGGQVYSLSPNDKRYAIQIPENVIQATGMSQN